MVSLPSFDANIFSFPVSDEVYSQLSSEEAGAPLFPKATQGLYPPGSLLKPIYHRSLPWKTASWMQTACSPMR